MRVSVGVVIANERAEDQAKHASENTVTRAHIKVVNAPCPQWSVPDRDPENTHLRAQSPQVSEFTQCSTCHVLCASRFTKRWTLKRYACYEICASKFTKRYACHEICTSRFSLGYVYDVQVPISQTRPLDSDF